MEFVNNTPLLAAMIPNGEDDDRITTLFLCAITYRIAGTRLEIVPEQRLLFLEPATHVPNDAVFSKEVVGVCATGFVYPAKGEEAREGFAGLRIGSVETHIVAYGTRVWRRGAFGGLVPSAPLPFDRVAMTWENAYGGMTNEPARIIDIDGEEAFVPEHEAGFPLNFDGKGFYTDESRAVDQPLPQLEDSKNLLCKWDDRPDPLCFAPYPLWGGLRAEYMVKDKGFEMSGMAKLGSRAAPRTTFDEIESGTEIILGGMRPRGEVLAFAVPRSPVRVVLRVGASSEILVPRLDSIEIDAEAREVRFVYRAKVTYGLVQFEERRAVMEPSEDFPVV